MGIQNKLIVNTVTVNPPSTILVDIGYARYFSSPTHGIIVSEGFHRSKRRPVSSSIPPYNITAHINQYFSVDSEVACAYMARNNPEVGILSHDGDLFPISVFGQLIVGNNNTWKVYSATPAECLRCILGGTDYNPALFTLRQLLDENVIKIKTSLPFTYKSIKKFIIDVLSNAPKARRCNVSNPIIPKFDEYVNIVLSICHYWQYGGLPDRLEGTIPKYEVQEVFRQQSLQTVT